MEDYSEEKVLSLFEFNKSIRNTIDDAELRQWVVGEINEIRTTSVGHVYLELIEKSTINGNVVARLRCNIWTNIARLIIRQFEDTTEQQLQAGQKVMVFVVAQYHESYGLSGNIIAINPSFTMGEMERAKREIINRLTQEGVIDMNKQLALPTVIQRIAVISAQTAAGYGDFISQLSNNDKSLSFRTTLFPAIVQGVGAENSIVAALDLISEHLDKFDVVVIIRGGGSRADLACFDSYEIANNIAQFPMPVITGIGHERDNSIADIVANTRLKTPTAVAEFLVAHNSNFLSRLETLCFDFEDIAKATISKRDDFLYSLQNELCNVVRSTLSTKISMCDNLYRKIAVASMMRQNAFQMKLSSLQNSLLSFSKQLVQHKLHKVESLETQLQANNPLEVLRKGYTLTMCGTKRVSSITDVSIGDKLTTITANGVIESEVKSI